MKKQITIPKSKSDHTPVHHFQDETSIEHLDDEEHLDDDYFILMSMVVKIILVEDWQRR